MLQQLLAQDVTEEDADERHSPQELQLFGDQVHRLVEARRAEMGMSAPPPPDQGRFIPLPSGPSAWRCSSGLALSQQRT